MHEVFGSEEINGEQILVLPENLPEDRFGKVVDSLYRLFNGVQGGDFGPGIISGFVYREAA